MLAAVRSACISASNRRGIIPLKRSPTTTPSFVLSTSSAVLGKHTNKIDRSKVPELNESDLEEHFVSGSGPGGQSVNKTVNCCHLRHRPTGFVVKVHHTRSLQENRQIARELLVTKLDNFYNGEKSVESQKKQIVLKRISIREAQQQRRRSLKEEWSQRNINRNANGIDVNAAVRCGES